MKYFFIAGESSGDLHAANLIAALQKADPETVVVGMGGDRMQKKGMRLVKHFREMSFMGFAEVLLNLRKILSFLKEIKKAILRESPDAVVLVDFAGFNLRVAKFAKDHNIKVLYYISPKVWAWQKSRARKIKDLVDRMYVILPFEEEFYKEFDYQVKYIGNPLLDAVADFSPDPDFISRNNLPDKKFIALLPGSREQELKTVLSLMLRLTKDYPGFHFLLAGVPGLPEELYQDAQENKNVTVLYDKTYDILSHSHAAIVTSGTATLETAFFEVPQVVVYVAGWISYQIGKRVIQLDYVSLVNLVAEKLLAKELIQHDFNYQNLKSELDKLVYDDEYRSYFAHEYHQIKTRVGEKGASSRAAEDIIKYLNQSID